MSSSTSLKATDYHRKPIRVLNTVLRGARALGLARLPLERDGLVAAARKATGLRDFGDESFLDPMQRLIESLEREADLNPLGRYMNRTNILRVLKHRLYAHELLTRHPEILERRIADPVVIVGLGRSGTTRLHRLLAADPRFLHLESWESVFPVPYPECFTARAEGRTDPRITSLEQGLKAVLYMSPQVAATHPLGTFEVEEEVGLLQHGFSSQIFEIQAKLPTFAEWLMTHDQHAAYEYMVVLMKIISWFRDDPQDKPWVLKTPQHMQDLDALLHVFPNAKLVCSHRDPIKCVGSICSTAWNAMVRDSDSITPDWLGPEWLNKTERMLHKTLRVREEMVAPQNQYDIQYADITADWQGAIQGVYDYLEMPFSDEARRGMQAWLDRNRQHKHGAHKYSLAEFGVSEQEVDERLMFYRQRFNIPYETKNPHLAASTNGAGIDNSNMETS
ncbi:MAG: sulfotransferase [Halioglobus sp.]|nr:sulfotransferase [Halioglobus sp.]